MTTTLQPVRYGMIDAVSPTTAFLHNNELGIFYVGAAKGVCRRLVMVFDLYGTPASGDAITSATPLASALLHCVGNTAGFTEPAPAPVSIYRLTQLLYDDTAATWNNYKAATAWAAGGGDYDAASPAPMALTIPSALPTVDTDYSMDALAHINDARTNRAGILGLVFRLDDESNTGANRYTQLRTHELVLTRADVTPAPIERPHGATLGSGRPQLVQRPTPAARPAAPARAARGR